MDTFDIFATGISVTLDLTVGHLQSFTVFSGDRELRPLHRAPWIGEPDLPSTLSPGGRRLSGDFFCAPFLANDVEPAPMHGWTANSRWSPISDEPVDGGRSVRFRLNKQVFGATVEKVLTVRHGHSFLYQEHVFIGGSGELPVAHHAMTAMTAGADIGFSPKRLALTGPLPLEADPSRGCSILAYPARTRDLSAFPTADGGHYDLSRYPVDGSFDDFVILVEEEGRELGWTAVARKAEDDVVLFLKNPNVLPVTMLWISNGGRDYAPWSGRNRGVLGVEDARSAIGHKSSIGDNPLKELGIPTAVTLVEKGRVRVRQVIGAASFAGVVSAPRSIDTSDGELRLTFETGRLETLPFDDLFLRSSL